MLYNAIVGSYLRYGVGSWGSCSSTLLNEISSAQNKIVRAILFLPYNADTSHGYLQLKILKLSEIFKIETTKLVHSIYHGYCPPAYSNFLSFPSHSYSTRLRQTQCFSLSKPRTNLGKKSLRFSGVNIWCQIPQNIKFSLDPKKMNFLLKNMFCP